jgi:ribonuclease Z
LKPDRDLCHIQTEHFLIEGRSRAGHETWFRVRDLNVALDIGRCPDGLISVPNILVSHAHLDHAVGIPFYAGQRHLQRMPGGNVFVPSEALDDFRALMEIHSRLEGTGYSIELIGMAPGEERRLSRTLKVRAHRATHRVPARAWELIAVRHHLKAELLGRDGHELAALRQEGVALEETAEVPVLFYTGDTDRGILEENEALYRAEVLMIECSFVLDGHQERAERYRHIHFDDLVDMADRFENRLIVLTHFSRRYAPEEVVEVLRRRCPPVLRERLRLAFAEPWQRL